MVANGMGIGGAETHIIELCRALQAKGHAVAVAAPDGVYTSKLREYRISTHTLCAFDGSIQSFLKQICSLYQIIGFVRPDVVHAHARPCALACDLLCKALHVPLVTTAHLPFCGCIHLSRWGDATLAVSDDIAAHLQTYYHIPRGQIKKTVNGIDCDVFSPMEQDRCKRILVHVSRLDPDRSQTAELLVQIAPRLYHDGLCRKLIIIGDGADRQKLALAAERVNRALGRDFVCMAGASNHIADVLRQCSVFVGVSRAALEAMACACPVILCGNEGYGGLLQQDYLDHFAKENFCCRSAGKPTGDKLYQDIKCAILMRPAEKSEWGRTLRHYVLRCYTPRRMAEDAEEVYQTALRLHRLPRVFVCGYHGYGNIGDDYALQKLLPILKQEAGSVTLLSRTPQNSRIDYGTKTLHRYRLLSLARAVKTGDLFLLAGGNLLQNQTGNRSLAYYLTVCGIAAIKGGRVGIVCGGIGELKGGCAQKIVGNLLRHCSPLLLRTPFDVAEAKKLASRSEPMCLHDASLAAVPTSLPKKRLPYVIVALRQPRQADSIKKTAMYVRQFCQKQGCRALFLPFHPQKDMAYLCQLAKYVPHSRIAYCSSAEQAMSVIAGGRCTITTRLHACYFSLLVGTPCLFLRYDEKTDAHVELLNRYAKRENFRSPVIKIIKMADALSVNVCLPTQIGGRKIPKELMFDRSFLRRAVRHEIRQGMRRADVSAPLFPLWSKVFFWTRDPKN